MTSDASIAHVAGQSSRFCRRWLPVLTLLVATSLGSGNLIAAQTDPSLPGLFQQLENAVGPDDATRLEAEIWQRWLDSDDEKAWRLMQRVQLSMSEADLDEALLLCNELVDYAPQYAEAWNKRATVFYMMGSYDASVADIQKTLQLEPRHFGAISGLGLIFLRKGNPEAALEAFEQVLRVSPQSRNARRSVESVKQQIQQEI